MSTQKLITVSAVMLEYIESTFDFEPTSTAIDKTTSITTYEYDQCDYWLNDEDKKSNDITIEKDSYFNFRARWAGVDDGENKGDLTLLLCAGDSVQCTIFG